MEIDYKQIWDELKRQIDRCLYEFDDDEIYSDEYDCLEVIKDMMNRLEGTIINDKNKG